MNRLPQNDIPVDTLKNIGKQASVQFKRRPHPSPSEQKRPSSQAKGGRVRAKRGMDAERVPLRQEGAAGRKAEPPALRRLD
jgi:hypothetical protein